MAINHVFTGVATADYEAAIAWYECLLGRPPDVIVKQDEAMWQLMGAGWIYVVADADRAGNAMLTLLVDDLDEHLAELAKRGLTAGPIDTVPGLYRKAVLRDRDGSLIQFGEAPSPTD